MVAYLSTRYLSIIPLLQLYAALSLATCLASVLVFPLPGLSFFDSSPARKWCLIAVWACRIPSGKTRFRTLFIGISQYRFYCTATSSSYYPALIWVSCRIVSAKTKYRDVGFHHSHIFNRLNITPEKVWGSLHGILSVGFAVWWQVTIHPTSSAPSHL
jgi:hypothetical protein